MTSIKSDSKTYYPHIVFLLVFGTSFFFGGIVNLVDPDALISVNGEEQLAALSNTWPMLLFGVFALFLALNYWFTIHRAEIIEDKLIINLFGRKQEYTLSQIKTAEVKFSFNAHLSIVKILASDGRRYKLHTDAVIHYLPNFFTKYPAYNSKMWIVLQNPERKCI